jgi:DNA-binding protein H-NS
MATEIERADAIRWIRAQMLEYGLTMEELEAGGCFAPPPSPRSVCCRNAEGLSWDGTGEMPDAAAGGQCGARWNISASSRPGDVNNVQTWHIG